MLLLVHQHPSSVMSHPVQAYKVTRGIHTDLADAFVRKRHQAEFTSCSAILLTVMLNTRTVLEACAWGIRQSNPNDEYRFVMESGENEAIAREPQLRTRPQTYPKDHSGLLWHRMTKPPLTCYMVFLADIKRKTTIQGRTSSKE
jgi:hypothetical protein